MRGSSSLGAVLGDSAWALGTAGFAFGAASASEAVATILVALERGVALIDTARAYTRAGDEATAEAIVGRALRAWDGPPPLVATKGGHWRDGESFPIDGRSATIRRHAEASLRTLGVERIDLYLLHHVDPDVPIEQSVGALAALQGDGLVQHIGLSNVDAAQLAAAERIAPIAAVQNRLSLAASDDLPLVAAARTRGISYLAYSPLGGTAAGPSPVAAAIAARRGVSSAQVQLAWLLSHGVVPVVGATRPETVVDSAGAPALVLSAAERAELDTAAGCERPGR